MPSLESFASLAQLGAGVGLALSVFVEPVRLTETKIQRRLDGDQRTIADPNEERGKAEKNLILLELFNLHRSARELERKTKTPMRLVKVGALLNFVLLVWCTLDPELKVDSMGSVLLLAAVIGPFALAWIWIGNLIAEHLHSPFARYENARKELG